jgi:hypothetical protein
MEMKVFDQVYSELTLLQQEDKDDLEIAEQSLMAAMVSNTFNGILAEYTLKDIQIKGE